MKKASPDSPISNLDDLRPEYDFDYSQSKPNRFAERLHPTDTAPPKPRSKAGARKAS